MEIDRKTLKALAADTRLDILKSLSKRRKMPSELSKELDLAASTITEHLDRLEEAGLIRREETGHKWIYYQLTEKGESLVKPRVPIQFILVLSLSLLIITAGFVYVNYYGGPNVASPSTFGTESGGLAQPAKTMTTGTNITNQTNTTNSTLPK
jgi:DNA-binding transcriptional ArsR family regulator